ncbi:IS66 family insertion sequence element accessory protein TnpB [Siminovitchia sp. FSL H7-0308]|uniref:IS66 family insertion sequence element accessory protein TnpA n=1 Tax=Siminovitchia sp. FSL H7-0308 TaxID=2921432 RepID=UPI0030EF4D6D
MTLKNKRIEWKERYTTWKESGKSIAEWCRNEEITLHQMYYWVRQFEEESVSSEADSPQWLTVQLGEEAFPSKQGAIFVHKGDLSVEVRTGADMALLSDILLVLQRPC